MEYLGKRDPEEPLQLLVEELEEEEEALGMEADGEEEGDQEGGDQDFKANNKKSIEEQEKEIEDQMKEYFDQLEEEDLRAAQVICS